MRICKIGGCEDKHYSRGWCKRHYMCWRRTGSPHHKRPHRHKHRPAGLSKGDLILFEFDRATIDKETGCILTQIGLTRAGYGTTYYNNRLVGLHRLSLEVFLDIELQPGEQANHVCDVPNCINPYHLYVGSKADNVHDTLEAGTHSRGEAPKGEDHHSAVLTEKIVRRLRRKHERLGKQFSIHKEAARYGMGYDAIYNVIKRKSWKHIP